MKYVDAVTENSNQYSDVTAIRGWWKPDTSDLMKGALEHSLKVDRAT
jgi:hypothetical protein